ncbi:MAG: phosphoglycolate phosphatase [Pseudomonadota bacterium]|uniref:phosphoglycolate phosphatase n=1 Tax=Gallaecimonas pentaromativorans TaxID=584787 RepID=UPI00067EB722|nr:phosphoglycolate phosphatase [Gallaecimonas pentaromativorans]MED5526846.1 phosphoglycolate phosphatase [Pseudomonadota bacterium]
MIKAVAFDLDGTLVHSLPDLAWAANAMRRQLGLAAVSEATVGQWIGNGIKKLVERACAELGEPANALALFESAYEGHLAVDSTLLADAIAVLAELEARGFKLALVTNKATRFAVPLVRELGLEPYFEHLLCGDTLAAKKPDPLPLTWLCQQWHIAPGELMLVGDSKNDIQAAQGAGCVSVGLTGGYNYGEDIGLCHPDFIIDSLAQLKTLGALQQRYS